MLRAYSHARQQAAQGYCDERSLYRLREPGRRLSARSGSGNSRNDSKRPAAVNLCDGFWHPTPLLLDMPVQA
jgi:hypothetical protein